MRDSLIKKSFSIILVVVMLFTMVPATIFAAEENQPMMMQFTAASSGDFHAGSYYNKVYSVTFLDSIDTEAMNGALYKWDISANAGSGEVMSWMYFNEEAAAAAGADRYDVYIAGEGGVWSHPSASYMFYMFSSLEKINNPENFRTDNVTTFFNTFYGCTSLKEVDFSSWNVSKVTSLNQMFCRCYSLEYANLSGWDTGNVTDMKGVFDMSPPKDLSPDYSLKRVDLTGWNTSKVTTMENMFRNCEALEELDLSSFDTSKVTTMRFMFYYCKSLKNIYVGEGWTTESIANIYDGIFNCCYALVGGTDNQEENIAIYNDKHPSAYYPPAVEYAKFKEEGGYLTNVTQKPQPEPKEYTVTYEFIGGVIPENVTPPEEKKYAEGSTADVEKNPSAEGYVFSGWTTTDVQVGADGNFTINNDVHFVGSWSKLYKVEYKYTEGFVVPDGAPALPAATTHEAGDLVDAYGVPYVYGYIFVGWTTEDADVTGDMFIMPGNDVTFYGYFKKPVESVEIIGGDITINEKEKSKINVYVKPEDATIKDIVYKSSDESVATVDKYGNITAVGEGTAEITVSSKDDPTKSDTVTVTVKVPVTEISVDKTEITLRTDGKDKLDVTVNEDATNKEVTFESSDESVVKVDKDGNVEAVGEGKAIITVTSKDDSSKKVTVAVTVKNPVTEIIVPDELTVELGDEKNLEAGVNEDATNKGLIYEAENAGIVKIDNEGNIVAVGEGTTTITITSQDNPEIKETVTVTVVKRYKVTYEFIGNVIPESITAPEEAVYLNGSEVAVEAEPDAEGYTFSGWLTDDVTVADGKFAINKDIHFVGYFKKNVTGIAVDKPVIELAPEGTDKITVTVTPDDATDKEVIFVSGDESIVRVDKDGNVEAVGEGETTITITSKGNPDLKVEIPVKVEKPYVPVEKIDVDKTEIKLTPDGIDKITVTVTPDDATDKDVIFVSGDESIVRVDKDGNVEAVGEGETTITVTSKGNPDLRAEIPVKVEKPYVPVGKIDVDKTEIKLTPDGIDKITVTVTPDDATDKDVIFVSGDESIVRVDKDGNVEAVGEGETTITVTSKGNPDLKAEIPVKVEKPVVPVTGITVNKSKFELAPEGTDKITVTFRPDDATNKEVLFESSNESIVRVDKDGNLEAVGEGEATITVTSKDNPNLKIEITVKVEKPVVPVTNITVDRSEIELDSDGKDKITVTVNPENATDKEVTFESSDETVVKVDKDGNLEAVGEGEATITVTSKGNPSLKTTVTVTVKGEEPSQPDEPDVPDEPDEPEKPEYTITVPGSVTIINGKTDRLDVKITPDDGTIKPVYTSSDESIVKVDADGVITGIGVGAATISVDFGGGDIRLIPVTVVAAPAIPTPPRKHHVCFGKTDGIGWYEVSVNGGDFFPQGPNSTLEVEEGSILVVRVQDMWIDDEFDFYVNGSKVPLDPANTITVVVDGYMLIGALSMDVPVPDVDESLTILEKIANFFADLINWFRNLFKRK